jgi:hypothetical protein
VSREPAKGFGRIRNRLQPRAVAGWARVEGGAEVDSVGYLSGTASDRRLPIHTDGWNIKADSVFLRLRHCPSRPHRSPSRPQSIELDQMHRRSGHWRHAVPNHEPPVCPKVAFGSPWRNGYGVRDTVVPSLLKSPNGGRIVLLHTENCKRLASWVEVLWVAVVGGVCKFRGERFVFSWWPC